MSLSVVCRYRVMLRMRITHDPLPRALAFDQNHQVIGVAREAVSSTFQLAVEWVQQDAGQQWRQRPALRGAHVAGFDVLTDQHPGAQPIRASNRSSAMVLLSRPINVGAGANVLSFGRVEIADGFAAAMA